MVYVMLGAPGSGKGTRAGVLKEKVGLLHISTGDLLKKDKEIYEKYGEEINSGKLLSDETMKEILKTRLMRDDVKEGCIIDGYPRTLKQAETLDEILSELGKKVDKAILVDASEELIYSRVLSRVVCPKCGEIYNKKYADENDNKCGKCSSELIIRKDDNEDSIKRRLEIFNQNIPAIRDYYEKKGVLAIVDASKEPEEILKKV